MLLDSFSEPLDLITSLLCFNLFTGFLLNRESNTTSRCCALKSSLIRPLPIPQTFFTFTPLFGSSVLLQTLECSEYHPSAHSPAVSALPFTRLQLSSHFIYPLTTRVVGVPQMISQPVSSIVPRSPLALPSGTWRTPGLSIP